MILVPLTFFAAYMAVAVPVFALLDAGAIFLYAGIAVTVGTVVYFGLRGIGRARQPKVFPTPEWSGEHMQALSADEDDTDAWRKKYWDEGAPTAFYEPVELDEYARRAEEEKVFEELAAARLADGDDPNWIRGEGGQWVETPNPGRPRTPQPEDERREFTPLDRLADALRTAESLLVDDDARLWGGS